MKNNFHETNVQLRSNNDRYPWKYDSRIVSRPRGILFSWFCSFFVLESVTRARWLERWRKFHRFAQLTFHRVRAATFHGGGTTARGAGNGGDGYRRGKMIGNC